MTEKRDGTARASLELLYHVSREFAGALDLRTVLQRVVLLSMQTVGAKSGSLIVLDDSGKAVESVIIAGKRVLDGTTQRLRVTLEKGLAGWVVENRQAALVSDTTQDERWIPSRYTSDGEKIPRSAVSAPILVRDRLVGVITLSHDKPGVFSEDHLHLVQAIADQAGISVLNARLYAESQRQARVMTALAESAAIITASLDVEEVLLRILQQVSQALSAASTALALVDPSAGELVFRASTGWKEPQKEEARLPLGRGITGWAAREGQVVIVQDAPSDPRYDPEIESRTGLKVTAIAAAPIFSKGKLIGVLEAANPIEGSFDPGAALTMTGIGSLAGTAIEHAQLFEKLQSAHRRYRELFEDSIEPIILTTCEGAIVEANRQAIQKFGYDRETLLSLSINDLHAVDTKKTGSCFELISSESTKTYESSLLLKSGQKLPVEVYVRQVNMEAGSYLQWILLDNAERKSLENLRKDLIAMIYHDLQSPLANVVSSLDMAETVLPPDDDTLQALIGIASRSTRRIQRLVDSLLDLNKLEAGQPIGVREIADPAELLNDAIETVEQSIQGKRQKICLKVEPDLPKVLVDPDMIRRVLINLIENAHKHSPSSSAIEAGAAEQDGQVWMWVQDDGPGIPEAEQERIFEKFSRLSGASKGLGLGLAFCKLAVEAHGGKIWVESQPGEGSKFIFCLPASAAEVPG